MQSCDEEAHPYHRLERNKHCLVPCFISTCKLVSADVRCGEITKDRRPSYILKEYLIKATILSGPLESAQALLVYSRNNDSPVQWVTMNNCVVNHRQISYYIWTPQVRNSCLQNLERCYNQFLGKNSQVIFFNACANTTACSISASKSSFVFH